MATKNEGIVIATAIAVLLGLRLLPAPRPAPSSWSAPAAEHAAPAAGNSVAGGVSGAEVPAPVAERPLLAGLDALAAGHHAAAYRSCSAAAAVEGLDRAPALVCQGRAALLLGEAARAAVLAQQALDLQDDAGAHVLAADALAAQGNCRGARVEYLRALDLEPDHAAAAAGLRRCGGTPPPPTRRHSGERGEEVHHALA